MQMSKPKKPYWERFRDLLNRHLDGSQGERWHAIMPLQLAPAIGYVAWPAEESRLNWPEDCPWPQDSLWAQAAIRCGFPLAQACDVVMSTEMEKGNLEPIAEWMKAGWTPGAPVLRKMAELIGEKKISMPQDPAASELRVQVRDMDLAAMVKANRAAGEKYENAIGDVAELTGETRDTIRNAFDTRFGRKVLKQQQSDLIAQIVTSAMSCGTATLDEAIDYTVGATGIPADVIEKAYKDFMSRD